MTDDELRSLVRDAIARHLGGGQTAPPAPDVVAPAPLWRSHASFAKFLLDRGVEEGGPCMIEPTVACNHCGYCQSYGH